LQKNRQFWLEICKLSVYDFDCQAKRRPEPPCGEFEPLFEPMPPESDDQREELDFNSRSVAVQPFPASDWPGGFSK
jgi:hypothetical protein